VRAGRQPPVEPGRGVASVEDYEALARERVPKEYFDYYSGGAGDEWTLRENRRAFDRWVLRPRFLVGVQERDTSTEVLGAPVAFPVLVAPWAFQELAHPAGESATARAAARAGTVMVLSSTSSHRLEEVAAATDAPKWFQLYVYRDRGFTREMLRRAKESGFRAIVWTVDAPLLGKRDRDWRNALDLPIAGPAQELDFDPSIAWDDLEWIREDAPGLPVLIKGILTGEDARLAARHGCEGVVVSNHGGRQLDGSPASLDALPGVVDAVEGHCEVLLDGGVRRGTDVLKALALGARAVMVGRPVAWGLAAAGEEGVVEILGLLQDELDLAMALVGCREVAEITPVFVAPARA